MNHRSERSSRRLLGALALILLGVCGPASDASASDPLLPPTAGGIEQIDRLLAKLSTHRRLMVVGAHPDDEDTTVLALVARGMGGEAAYLSLSRGDGGQNLIGPELGVGLGLLRSRELEAARRVDGARQYFSRAYDFGYTRSLDETFERWPREVLLEDTVRAIRRFKPQVIVSVFPPDERAGHGQHQASGVVSGEAFELAGKPAAFPELIHEGIVPWRPQTFYRAAWWRPEGATFRYPLGVVDPVTGRSMFQIAMDSRSQHRCQDMGMLQPLGPFDSGVVWEAGGGGPEGGELFAGVDTSLSGIAEHLHSDRRARVAPELAAIEALAHEARRNLTPADPRAVLPAALEIHRRLAALRQDFPQHADANSMRAEDYTFLQLLFEKQQAARDLVLAASGIALDAYADRETLVPGDELTVELAVWDSAQLGVEVLRAQLVAGSLTVEPAEPEARSGFAARFFGAGDQPERGFHLRTFRVRVPAELEPTVPYFLDRPLRGDLYDWTSAPDEVLGKPFGPPPMSAFFYLRIEGELFTVWREVVSRQRDQARGEVRRPLRVIPEIEIAAAEPVVVWPTDETAPRAIEVELTSHAVVPVSGQVEVEVPDGWPAADPAPFDLPAAGARQTVTLHLTPPDPYRSGRFAVRLAAVTDSHWTGDVQRYEMALPLIDYPHVRPTPLPVPAEVRISATDLELPGLRSIGYVRGASDRVPEALSDVGMPIEILDPGDLGAADLSGYDAIVIGSRAYETEPALAQANPRLLEYVEAGGLLVVQYQQYQYVAGGFSPYPLEIARPHGRVTDETAPVTRLQPEHPVFLHPNRLRADDWQGWVQERGLYMPATWDEPLAPLLEMADPGGEPQRGGLLVAPLGSGTFVYTGLAFFRQLPAGVPGAFRLFANLLALAEPTPDSAAASNRPGDRR